MRDICSVPDPRRLTRPGSTSSKPRGRHPQQRLTAVGIRHTRRPGRYADGNGLYLVVDPSGAKRWIWRGMVQRRRCDLGLGGVDLVPLVDARAEALRCRRIARTGGNPKLDRAQAKRIVLTFKDAALRVHTEHSPTFRNVKHRAEWLSSLERDVFPVIGSRPVDTIDSSDVLRVLSAVWTKKPETARRLKQRMKLVFDWAKAAEFRTGDNPVEGMTRVLPKHRDQVDHHAALPYQTVSAFVTTLRAASQISPSIRFAFELLILTALRTTEVLHARWAEFDLDAAVWTVPGCRMKSGRDHRVPLCARVLEILRALQQTRRGDEPYVFAGRRPGKPLSNMALLMALRRLKRDDITAHGFRSSFRDWAAERTNVPHAVCEAALAHVLKNKTEAAYNRTDLFDRRRELMDLWGRFVTATPADVVAIGA